MGRIPAVYARWRISTARVRSNRVGQIAVDGQQFIDGRRLDNRCRGSGGNPPQKPVASHLRWRQRPGAHRHWQHAAWHSADNAPDETLVNHGDQVSAIRFCVNTKELETWHDTKNTCQRAALIAPRWPVDDASSAARLHFRVADFADQNDVGSCRRKCRMALANSLLSPAIDLGLTGHWHTVLNRMSR